MIQKQSYTESEVDRSMSSKYIVFGVDVGLAIGEKLTSVSDGKGTLNTKLEPSGTSRMSQLSSSSNL